MYLVQDNPALAELVLDRPPANPIGLAEIEKLNGILDKLSGNGDIKVLVVRSASRMFCAGADLQMMEELGAGPSGPAALAAFAADMQTVFRRLRNMPFCTIAAIGGVATGGGLELALSCDLRVIGKSVRCGLSEILLGLIPGAGGTQLVSEIAGKGVAARMILTGELVTGEEAQRLNLVQYVTDDADVQSFSLRLAKNIARQPRQAIEVAKRCISLAGTAGGYEEEIAGTRVLQGATETKALIAAFMASRKTAASKVSSSAKNKGP